MSTVSHEKRLSDVLRGMRYRVEAGRFALLGFPEAPGPADLEALADVPSQLVREVGETTLLVRDTHAPAIRARHPGARVVTGLCWIRFESPMDWDVVGFLARVARELATAGIPIGAVCGFSRDHVFVDERYLSLARERLDNLFGPH